MITYMGRLSARVLTVHERSFNVSSACIDLFHALIFDNAKDNDNSSAQIYGHAAFGSDY